MLFSKLVVKLWKSEFNRSFLEFDQLKNNDWTLIIHSKIDHPLNLYILNLDLSLKEHNDFDWILHIINFKS